eukprot:COSAG06_NODE_2605_length_6590_cov_2.260360_5_plen_62_part_00
MTSQQQAAHVLGPPSQSELEHASRTHANRIMLGYSQNSCCIRTYGTYSKYLYGMEGARKAV